MRITLIQKRKAVLPHLTLPQAGASLSAPGGGEGQGEVEGFAMDVLFFSK